MNYRKQFNIHLLILVGILFISLSKIQAQSVKGTVLDDQTGEPLQGATVSIKETGQKAFVNLDGKFSVKLPKSGNYTLVISSVNYTNVEQIVRVDAKTPTTVDFKLVVSRKALQEVTVVFDKANDKRVRSLERNSNQVVNIVSAKTIQLLPDITVANVLQRVSGVTIEKSSSGEARYPIIRGMEKRYINTLVNGIKIPSPDNKSRFVPLDLFPSEILERLEVSKSLTASMEADAIGGTINLVMKDAPVQKLFQVNASLGYNTIFGDQSFQSFKKSDLSKSSPAELNGSKYQAVPSDFQIKSLNYSEKKSPLNGTFGITYGNRFGKDKKFGFIVSGSYQSIHSGTNSTFFLPNAQPNLNNIPGFIDLYARTYSTGNQRMGLNTKFDYKWNEKNKISWFNTLVRLDQTQVRVNSDTVALNSLVTESFRSIWQYQSIFNSTLQGVHQLAPHFGADWSVGVSSAANHAPDQASFSHQFPVNLSADGKQYSRGTPDILGTMSRVWLRNKDNDVSAYLNFTEKTKLLGGPLELKVGGMLRDKHRSNFYNSYSLNPQQGSTGNQLYTSINNAVYTFTGSNATPGLNGNNYTFDEQIWAAYAQGKWLATRKLEFIYGVRLETTRQHYNTELDSSVTARLGTISYTDVLPSAQVKYAINEHHNVRFAYYEAIARPQFAELIPDGPDNFETFKEVGNPLTLKHSLANNFDLRYEWLPGKGADQVLVGAFYKNIQDPIEFAAVKSGPTSQNLKPINIGNATNYGFELVLTKYFGKFGIAANYTYTQSRVTNDSMLYYYRNDAGSITTKYVSETRPLQGQANHVGNISLIYKNPKHGFDAQLAMVYNGERISLVSPYAGLHYWQQPTATLDFSFEKKMGKGWSFYGKFNNLTNTPTVGSLHVPYNTYIASSGSRALALQTHPSSQIIVQKDYVRSSLLLGVRFKL